MIADNLAVSVLVIVLAGVGLVAIFGGLWAALFTAWIRTETAIRNHRPRPKRKRRH